MQSFFCFTQKQRKSNNFAIIYYEIFYAVKMHLEVIYKLQIFNMGIVWYGRGGEGKGKYVFRCLANKCAIKLIEIALCLFVQQFMENKQVWQALCLSSDRKSSQRKRKSSSVCDRNRDKVNVKNFERKREKVKPHFGFCGVLTILLSC